MPDTTEQQDRTITLPSQFFPDKENEYTLVEYVEEWTRHTLSFYRLTENIGEHERVDDFKQWVKATATKRFEELYEEQNQ